MLNIALKGLNRPKEERFICDFCKCVFDTDEYLEYPQYGVSSDGRVTNIMLEHECPTCGKKVYICR